MSQQQEQALVAAFRQLSPKWKGMILRTTQAGAERCAERKAATKPSHLHLIVNNRPKQ